jgi:phosphate uptake regulator
MKRKVIKLGKSSTVISLPQKWVKEHSLYPGDELNLKINENSILLTKKHQIIKKSKTFEAFNNIKTTRRLISSLYRQGYTDITVTNTNSKTTEQLYDITEKKLIGFEVVSQKDNSCTLKQLGEIKEEDFDNSLRRIFLLLLEMSEEILNKIKNKEPLESIKFLEDNINKFSIYCERILIIFRNKLKKTYDYYYLVKQLEEIGDHYHIIVRELGTQTLKKDALELLKLTNRNLRYYYELFYKFDLEKLELFESKLRKDIKVINKNDWVKVMLKEINILIDSTISPLISINS